MKILIVEPYITGHHLEYLHHIYMMTLLMPDSNFVFVLPKSFEEAKKLFDWPENRNVIFELSLPTKSRNAKKSSIIGSLKKSIFYSKLTKLYINKYKPDALFSLYIMTLVPFLPFSIFSKVHTIGIVYDIYLRKERVSSKERIVNFMRYKVLAQSCLFKKIFILNDKVSANRLNEKYHTKKFSYLPDPYVPLLTKEYDFRKENNIDKSKIVFAHFGSMTRRKGTLDILNYMSSLSAHQCARYVFVFAGKVNEEIKNEFYNYINSYKEKVEILVFDDFCSYDFLAGLCKAASAILIPYHDTCKSSGLIGYASQFGVPVVAYSGGLLEELIRKYNLGIIADKGMTLVDAYSIVENKKYTSPSRKYCDDNNVSNFIKILKEAFIE